MTDAGFFRGTTADQDNRFANKQKKLLKELNFSPILNTKLNMSKIDLDGLRPWIDQKIKDVLEKDDEILSESIYEHLAEKEPDGKSILLLITGFVDDNKASKFLEDLWTKLIDLQDNSNGIDKSDNDNNDSETKSKETDEAEHIEKLEGVSNTNLNDDNAKNKDSKDRHQSSSSSHSATAPSRSVSKSPGNLKLDELSRGRPRRRLQDDVSSDGSKPSPVQEKRKGRSRSRSSHRSQSDSATPRSNIGNEGMRRRSSSSSKSLRSDTRSRSRSYSRSASRLRSSTRSRSRTRSPRRSRSPLGYSHRGRRSRSRSRGYRIRSRSPIGRRGFASGRGPYRGSFGYHDRRRGAIAPFRRRSPWGRRRYSPRSPPRRRRSPTFSPRRRRSPSPYNRRSRSRSPLGHIMHRHLASPRLHSGPSHMDIMEGRHGLGLHHDMHRPMLQAARGSRDAVGYRTYSEGHAQPRHSPGRIMTKISNLPSSHTTLTGPLDPPIPGPNSPPSSRKKHKKDKKHRKHKKSKKHRSVSPEKKKKKHKKHKKTKKSHKSH